MTILPPPDVEAFLKRHGAQLEYLRLPQSHDHTADTDCVEGDTRDGHATGGSVDLEAQMRVYKLPVGARFSLCEPEASHGGPNRSDQNVIVGRAFQHDVGADNQADRANARVPFISNEGRQVAERLPNKSFQNPISAKCSDLFRGIMKAIRGIKQ